MPLDHKNSHKIQSVAPGSIAEELGVEPGDVLISINDQEVEDVFDYRYLTQDEELTVVIRKGNSMEEDEPEEWELEIEKEPDEDLGIEFESGLMDEYRSCRNRCIFCFVNQMPKGMRDTLYFHDDDARLSFLQGNYITLTNMSDHDIDRIIRYHLEPINISFHTMNPALRCEMLHNRTAGDVFPRIRRLKEAGIELNGQIVLCRGINDGEELEYSLREFEQYLPELKSVSVVPVGLTRFRDRLPKLIPFDADSAGPVIDQIERWQQYYMTRYGTHLVHASDEWYIMAGRELPPEESYDGYLQLENGVGMVRLLTEEIREELRRSAGRKARSRHITIATGRLVGPILDGLVREITEVFPQVRADVVPITNHFFGELITVSGLITGQDLTAQLAGRDL
ncbi:MAG: DUF512 domain-containing protein, partial [Lachnospiraceae bacterium]|nr:DUF512 domain-containing protein [Lachnospiraceae bacterium]